MASNQVNYKHQDEALSLALEQGRTHFALFLHPGLGKTNITLQIASQLYTAGIIKKLLVIAPNRVHKQWAVEQVPKWTRCEHSAFHDEKAYYRALASGRAKGLIIRTTNVETFSTKDKWLQYKEWEPDMIVLDEATSIKNPTSKRSTRILSIFNDVTMRGRRVAASKPKTKYRMVLTGTPVTNSPFDLWSMFEFLKPGYFGMNYYAFIARYGIYHTQVINGRNIPLLLTQEVWKAVHGMSSLAALLTFNIDLDTYNYIRAQTAYSGPYRHLDELKQLIRDDAMFRTLTECVDMPTQTYVNKLVEMSPEQTRMYREMEKDLIAQSDAGLITDAKSKMAALIRLQQLASGFMVPTLEEDTPATDKVWISKEKVQAVLTETEARVPGGHIIVTHFHAEAEALYEAFTNERPEAKIVLMTGWKKVGNITDDFDYLIANIKVISKGFNLQRCHYMHFYSNTFSLEDRIQTEGRIFRIGQTEPCIYVDYITTDTIDMKVSAVLKQKGALLDYIMDQSVTSLLTKVDETFVKEYGELLNEV